MQCPNNHAKFRETTKIARVRTQPWCNKAFQLELTSYHILLTNLTRIGHVFHLTWSWVTAVILLSQATEGETESGVPVANLLVRHPLDAEIQHARGHARTRMSRWANSAFIDPCSYALPYQIIILFWCDSTNTCISKRIWCSLNLVSQPIFSLTIFPCNRTQLLRCALCLAPPSPSH